MSRYEKMFARLESEKRGAFIPFLIAADPTPQTSLRCIQQVIDSGADALEIGIAFSDPTADGPVIQRSISKLIENEYSVEKAFEVIRHVRQDNAEIPIGLLVYINLVAANGIEGFFKKCQQVGVDSVLIADLPVEHSESINQCARSFGIDLVFICPPNADEDLVKKVAQAGSGYTYLVSRDGVTGDQNSEVVNLESRIELLKQYDAPPVVLGFGISQPDHVRHAIQSGASGAISGSAICRIMQENASDVSNCVLALGEYVRLMKSAT